MFCTVAPTTRLPPSPPPLAASPPNAQHAGVNAGVSNGLTPWTWPAVDIEAYLRIVDNVHEHQAERRAAREPAGAAVGLAVSRHRQRALGGLGRGIITYPNTMLATKRKPVHI